MYFLLSVFLIFDYQHPKLNLFKGKVYFLIILAGISVGIFVELIQGIFIYQRYFDIFDIIANSFGTIIGAYTMRLIGRKLI